jgi:hypothetical protein
MVVLRKQLGEQVAVRAKEQERHEQADGSSQRCHTTVTPLCNHVTPLYHHCDTTVTPLYHHCDSTVTFL